MTVIIGFTNKSGGYIGCDGQVTQDYHVNSTHETKYKVFNNNLAVCYSGLARVGTVIKNRLEIPDNIKNADDDVYVYNVTERIKGCLSEAIDFESEDTFNLIAVYNKNIYYIDRAYCLIKIYERYYAEGHGAAYAMGAMYAVETRCDFKNKESKQYAEYVIQAGLDAAIQHSCCCGGDTQIIKIGNV